MKVNKLFANEQLKRGKLRFIWEQAVGGAANGIISGAINLGLSAYNNKLAKEREALARKENFTYSEMAADAADRRTRALFTDLYSPSAQRQQLEAAGLNPALMYGMAGSVGQATPTGAQGGGASGISPNVFGATAPDIATAQLAYAQADLAHEQADKLRGKNAEGEANVANIVADTAKKLAEKNLTEASQKLTESNTILTDLHSQLASSTMEFNVNKANAEADKACTLATQAMWETLSAQYKATYDAETLQSRINTVDLQNKLLKADELLRKSQIHLNDTERERFAAEINKWQKEISLGIGELQVKLQDANTRREYNRILEEFYDAQVENLQNRLSFDKDKFKKENAREWTKTIGTIVNDFLGNVSHFIMATCMI